jgi:hypothetical protein
MHAITIGLDIAKSVFQVHAEDADGRIVVQKRLRRSQVTVFSPGCRRLWLASRPAARRTAGGGRCGRTAMRCG